MCRGLLTALLLAVLVTAAPGAGPAPAQTACDGSTPNPPTTDPQVTISGLPATAGNELGLAFTRGGGGDVVPGSLRYDVDGPAGHTSPAADRYFAAQYTPDVPGTYTITAHWQEYACADYRADYRDIATPATTFTTSTAVPPTVSIRTVRRPRVANDPGHATLEAFLDCPDRRRSDKTPTRLAVYHTTDGRAATHASRHVVLGVSDGCWGGTWGRTVRTTRSKLRIEISRALIAVEVTAPGRADVLAEIRYGDRLLKSVRARFRRSATGESVRRG